MGPSFNPNWAWATNPSAFLFGGQTAAGVYPPGYQNDLWMFDMTRQQWFQLRVATQYPAARQLFAMATIGASVYLHGGQDGSLNVLNDLWLASLTVSADLTALSASNGISWSLAPVLSAVRPASRSAHAAVVTRGQFYIYGGLGPAVVGGQAQLFADLWAYSPVTSFWLQIQGTDTNGNQINVPNGRYGHAMQVISSSRSDTMYVFGGITPVGDTAGTYTLS